MLQILETKNDRRHAQQSLMRALHQQMKNLGQRNMGFPGGNLTTNMRTIGDERLFYAYFKTDGIGGIERYWNAFGIYESGRQSQDITVEINVAVESPSKKVAAFYARDNANGYIYILHSGRVGGGYEGVGQNAFLSWSKNRLVESFDSQGRPARLGILLGRVDDNKIAIRIERFVHQVVSFKQAVRKNELNAADLIETSKEIETFKAEFSGRKTGQRNSLDIDYISIHGAIVDALYEGREARKTLTEIVLNNNYIDLFVKENGLVKEIYEVKPSVSSQSIYTAVGQLIIHGNEYGSPKMHLVIPFGHKFSSKIAAALDKYEINVLFFRENTLGNYTILY